MAKQAVRRLVRGEDGRMHMRFFDLNTGTPLNSLVGYDVVEIPGAFDLYEGTTEEDKPKEKSDRDPAPAAETERQENRGERMGTAAGDKVGDRFETYTGPDQWGPGVALQERVQMYMTKPGGIAYKLDKVENTLRGTLNKAAKAFNMPSLASTEVRTNTLPDEFDDSNIDQIETASIAPTGQGGQQGGYNPAAPASRGRANISDLGAYPSTPYKQDNPQSPIQTSASNTQIVSQFNPTQGIKSPSQAVINNAFGGAGSKAPTPSAPAAPRSSTGLPPGVQQGNFAVERTIAQQIASGAMPITNAGQAMAYIAERQPAPGTPHVSPAAAAGIVGSLVNEGGFDPNKLGDKGKSVGGFQVQKDMRNNLGAYTASIGAPSYGTIKDQIDFVLDHALNPQSEWRDPTAIAKGVDKIFSAKDARSAAVAFTDVFERPSTPHYNARIQSAQQTLDAYTNGQTLQTPYGNPAGEIRDLQFDATKNTAPGTYGADYLAGGRTPAPENVFDPYSQATNAANGFAAPFAPDAENLTSVLTSSIKPDSPYNPNQTFGGDYFTGGNLSSRPATLDDALERAIMGQGSFAANPRVGGAFDAIGSYGGTGSGSFAPGGTFDRLGGVVDTNRDYSGNFNSSDRGDGIAAGRGGVTAGGYSSDTWGGAGEGYNAFDSSSGGGFGSSYGGGGFGGGVSSAESAAQGGFGSSRGGEFG